MIKAGDFVKSENGLSIIYVSNWNEDGHWFIGNYLYHFLSHIDTEQEFSFYKSNVVKVSYEDLENIIPKDDLESAKKHIKIFIKKQIFE